MLDGFTTESDEPTTNSAGTESERAAVAADGLVLAAASVATVSMPGFADAASTAAPPPIEWPRTASRVGCELGWVACPQAMAAPRSFAKAEWLGSRPVWLFGAITM